MLKKHYKTWFKVIYDRKTLSIKKEIWGLKWRYFWPLPWISLKTPIEFYSYEEVMDWCEKNGIDPKFVEYNRYGKEIAI